MSRTGSEAASTPRQPDPLDRARAAGGKPLARFKEAWGLQTTPKLLPLPRCMLLGVSRLLFRPLVLPRRLSHSSSMSTLAATGRENLPLAGAEPAAKLQRTEPPVEILRVRRLNEHALLPKRGSSGAAGYDLARCVLLCAVSADMNGTEGALRLHGASKV